MSEIKAWKCDICSETIDEVFRQRTESIRTAKRPINFTLLIEGGDFCNRETARYLPEFIKKLEEWIKWIKATEEKKERDNAGETS